MTLLEEIFSHDFTSCKEPAQLRSQFFARQLSILDLRKVHDSIAQAQLMIGGKNIPAAIRIKGKNSDAPFGILAQIHGNEPAGLAGILFAMALSQAGFLEQDIIGVIGNPLASMQYFEAYEAAPHTRQETRDCYRCGLAPDGSLLPDMNRIPVDFLTRQPVDHQIKRAREIYHIGQHINGLIDIHSARGNMLCITDHVKDIELKYSPIRSVLTGIAEAISAHASATVTLQTFKTILMPLPNIKHQVGIEAGRHEHPNAPYNAASFTLSLLYTLGLTRVEPLFEDENGIFEGYAVQPRITYADLDYGDTLRPEDLIYMTKQCHSLASVPARSDTVIVKKGDGVYALQHITEFTQKPAGSMEYAVYQYDEMEAIDAGSVVAAAIPSGTAFKTHNAFSGIFVSKSATLYDKDPAVGPWPVAADKINSVKFCYPCNVAPLKLDFG